MIKRLMNRQFLMDCVKRPVKAVKTFYYIWQFRYHLWKANRACIYLLKHGKVEHIKKVSNYFRTLAHNHDLPEALELAQTIELNAENIILARIGFRRRIR